MEWGPDTDDSAPGSSFADVLKSGELLCRQVALLRSFVFFCCYSSSGILLISLDNCVCFFPLLDITRWKRLSQTTFLKGFQ